MNKDVYAVLGSPQRRLALMGVYDGLDRPFKLHDEYGIEHTTASRAFSSLVLAGLAEKHESSTKRAATYVLTPFGERVAAIVSLLDVLIEDANGVVR